jgi:DDE family transposase
MMTGQNVTYFYELMDAAYDAQIIRDYSKSKGHVPLIDYNRRSLKDAREFAPHEAQRYKERSSAERVNSNLKDNFGGRFVRVRGHAKVFSHLMFGLLALTIAQTIRLLF